MLGLPEEIKGWSLHSLQVVRISIYLAEESASTMEVDRRHVWRIDGL